MSRWFFQCLFLIILFCLSSVSFADAPKSAQIFGDPATKKVTVTLGGSFFPPHGEHLRNLAELMYRFGLTSAELMPTMPYKKGTTEKDGQIALELTRVAVTHFDEVLEINGFDYRDFKVIEDGVVSWTGPNGQTFQLLVNGLEINEKIKENTILTETRLQELRGGDATTGVMVAGGDSAASMPKWGSRWKELFLHNSWIFVIRKGFDQGPTALNFDDHDPLRRVYGPEFVAEYEAPAYDAVNQTVTYTRKDHPQTKIAIIDQPSLDLSSSAIRMSFQEDSDHTLAQDSLPPSVFFECLHRGLFLNKTSQTSDDKATASVSTDTSVENSTAHSDTYKLYSQKNLEIALRWLFKKIEKSDLDKVNPEDQQRFAAMLNTMVEIAGQIVKENKSKNRIVAFLVHAYEHVVEHLGEIKNLRNLRKLLREKEQEFGGKQIAAVAIGAEIIEQTVFPPLAYYLWGAKGLAAVPFFHPNETVVIPGYMLWLYHKSQVEKKDLGGGSLKFYRELTDYRNRLLRGDPSRIISRVKLEGALGLSGTNLILNIITSSWPSIFPLRFRKMYDKGIKYYDVDISTNELAACLKNQALAKVLWEQSQKNYAIYAQLLLVAIMQDSGARSRLEFFATQRYFKGLYLGDMPDELLGGFDPREQKAILAIRSRAVKPDGLDADRMQTYSRLVSAFYSWAKIIQTRPDAAQNSIVWENFLDLLIHGYPGRKLNLKSKKHAERFVTRMKILSRALTAKFPNLFLGYTVTYAGRDLVTLGEEAVFHHPLLQAAEERLKGKNAGEKAQLQGLEFAVLDYIQINGDVMKVDKPTDTPSITVLPTNSRGADLKSGNLVWEMHVLSAYVDKQQAALTETFYRATVFLSGREQHRYTTNIFWAALDHITDDIKALKKELTKQEYAWLRTKYPYRVYGPDHDETQIPNYENTVKQYTGIRQQFEAKLESLRSLNHIMFGTIPVDLMDPNHLRESIGQLLSINDSKKVALLGATLRERAKNMVKNIAATVCAIALEEIRSYSK